MTACDYNLRFSLRMLAIQILRMGGGLAVPTYVGRSAAQRRRSEASASKEDFQPIKQVVYGPEQVVECRASEDADICLQFGRHRLLMRFAYRGRTFPASLYAPPDASCGVLSITLDSVLRVLSECEEESGAGLRARLKDELLESTRHKHWVYHPSQGARAAVDKFSGSPAAGTLRGARVAKRQISQAEIDAAVIAAVPIKQK